MPYSKQSTRQKVLDTREWVVKELGTLGFSIVPSHANFVLIQHEKVHAGQLYEDLREEGVLVRYFDKPRVNNYLRVSIGTETEMEFFLKKIGKLLNKRY